MNINEIIKKSETATTPAILFDTLCILEDFINKNKNIDKEIFDFMKSKDGKNSYRSMKVEYTLDCINFFFKTDGFKKSLTSVCRFYKNGNSRNNLDLEIEKDFQFLNFSLDLSFYIIARFSKDLSQKQIEFISDGFMVTLKDIELSMSFEFTFIDILNSLEDAVFDAKPLYKKYPMKFDDKDFYENLKKVRLIAGNYLVNISSPIILSNSFKKILKLKKQHADEFDITAGINTLDQSLKKYEFLKKGFNIKIESEDLSSFRFFFEHRESSKIFFLVEEVILHLRRTEDREPIKNKILKMIRESKISLEKVSDFFLNNFSVFIKDSKVFEKNQWSNKSFLNTIKFLSVLSSIKEGNNQGWQISIFIKHFHLWINDIDENVNYFSSLDDWTDVVDSLRGGENNYTEFKSTFGFHLAQGDNEEIIVLNAKKKDIEIKIAETILSMANSDGGEIYIGIIEKPEEIKRNDLKSKIKERDGLFFFDINQSLKLEEENFDKKRLKMQQILVNLTGERMDFLDNIFKFFFYKIYIEQDQSFVEILKIKIEKSSRLIFIVKDRNYITLPKRLHGRVEMINPKEEIISKGKAVSHL